MKKQPTSYIKERISTDLFLASDDRVVKAHIITGIDNWDLGTIYKPFAETYSGTSIAIGNHWTTLTEAEDEAKVLFDGEVQRLAEERERIRQQVE